MKQVYFIVFLSLLLSTSAQTPEQIDSLNKAAEVLLNSNPQQALEISRATTEKAGKGGYTSGINKSFALRGVANYKLDRYDMARLRIDTAITLSRQSNDTSTLAYALYWKGNTEIHDGNYAKALDSYQEANTLSSRTNDMFNLIRSIDGKASIYETLNQLDKAEDYYLEALKLSNEYGFKEWIPTVKFSLANMAYRQGKKDVAEKGYREAIQLSEENGNQNNKAACLQQLASLAYESGKQKQAMEYIQQALDLFKQTGSESSYSYGRLLMSAILIQDKEWDVAIKLAQESLNEGREKKETTLQRDAAEILYYAYNAKNQPAKALEYHELFHQLSEKGHSEELSKKLAQLELQTNFESERSIQNALRESEKAQMNAKLEEQKLMQKAVWVVLLFIATIAALSVFAFAQKRKDTRLIAEEKQKSDAVLAGLLPHEIYSQVKAMRNTEAPERSTVLFADIKGSIPKEDREWFSALFSTLAGKHNLQKIDGEEDVFMAISKPGNSEKHMAARTIRAGLELLESVKNRPTPLEIGLGIHTGAVIAGVIGLKIADHDVWGDTMDGAARIEQHGMRGKVNISETTCQLVNKDFKCVDYGTIPQDGGKELGMYFIELS
jgi:adenylate cyclase